MKANPTPVDIRNSIPPHCLKTDTKKSVSYLLRDMILLITLFTAIIFFDNYLIALPLSLLLGTVLTGLFVIGHDCGHRSFSQSETVCDVVGEFATGLCLWPYQAWRISHNVHHGNTHHIDKDIAWQPFTVKEYQNSTPLIRFIYRHTRTKLFFLGGIIFSFLYGIQGFMLRPSRFNKAHHQKIRRSALVMSVLCLVWISLAWYFGGLYGVLLTFVLPQFVFQFWLSTFTFFHHTSPDIRFMSEQEWTPGKAMLGATVFVRYPKIVDWLTHDISWHVPHHASVSIPHYHLREVHHSLKSQFVEHMYEANMNMGLIRRVITQCCLVQENESGALEWLGIDYLRDVEKMISKN